MNPNRLLTLADPQRAAVGADAVHVGEHEGEEGRGRLLGLEREAVCVAGGWVGIYLCYFINICVCVCECVYIYFYDICIYMCV